MKLKKITYISFTYRFVGSTGCEDVVCPESQEHGVDRLYRTMQVGTRTPGLAAIGAGMRPLGLTAIGAGARPHVLTATWAGAQDTGVLWALARP